MKRLLTPLYGNNPCGGALTQQLSSMASLQHSTTPATTHIIHIKKTTSAATLSTAGPLSQSEAKTASSKHSPLPHRLGAAMLHIRSAGMPGNSKHATQHTHYAAPSAVRQSMQHKIANKQVGLIAASCFLVLYSMFEPPPSTRNAPRNSQPRHACRSMPNTAHDMLPWRDSAKA